MKNYIKAQMDKCIKPLLIKDECEKCGSSESLDLHHIFSFNRMFEQCHCNLNIEERENVEDYSQIELDNIINYMLGLHIHSAHLTLCEKCYENIHKELSLKYPSICENNLLKKKEHEKRIKTVLIPYLKDKVGELMLQTKDRQQLIKKINYRRNGKLIKKIENLNAFLEQNNVPYKILKISISKMIDEKKKRYPNTWKIVRLKQGVMGSF